VRYRVSGVIYTVHDIRLRGRARNACRLIEQWVVSGWLWPFGEQVEQYV
jgi:hypothetical protein